MNYTEEQLRLIEQINSTIQRINTGYNLKLTFRNDGIVHIVYEDGSPIITDSLNAIKIYLHGLEYGLIKSKKS